MKHVHSVTFMGMLWKAFDGRGRELASGYIDSRTCAQYFQTPRDIFLTNPSGQPVRAETWEILEDVNNQINLLQKPGNDGPG